MKKIILLFITVFNAFICTIYAQQNISLDNNAGTMDYFTLPNGLTVFVKEDSSSALIHMELTVNAGFSQQQSYNAGFFTLYSRLFCTTADRLEQNLFTSIPLESQCNQDNSSYSAAIPCEAFEDYLSLLCECLNHPYFTDSKIHKEFNALKTEVLEYQESDAGFINTSIDYRVYNDEPWKHDSGIYPSLFTGFSDQQVRTILFDIAKRYYTPDNCALFITGNISGKNAYQIISKAFNSWNTHFKENESEAFVKDSSQNQKRRFVLTSPNFSPELIQLVVQYTDLSLSECEILNAAFTAPGINIASSLSKTKDLGIRSKEYVSLASINTKKMNRLVLQAIMEPVEQEEYSPVKQTIDFMNKFESLCKMERSDFITSQNIALGEYRNTASDSVMLIKLLSEYWSWNNGIAAKGFYSRFTDLFYDIQNQSSSSLNNSLNKANPYIFILVNDSVYQQFKQDFNNQDFSLITKDNGSWYTSELLANLAKEKYKKELNNSISEDTNEIQNIKLNDSYKNFYSKNTETITQYKLDNNIPVILKKYDSSNQATISLSIKGGEASSPLKERYLRTILINAFARNIQKQINTQRMDNNLFNPTQLFAWTEENVSYIVLKCTEQDFNICLRTIADAVIFGQLTPYDTDRFINEQRYQWNSKTADLGVQLRYNALEYLFRGTNLSSMYDMDQSIAQNTSFDSINKAYTQLLDASLYTLVICSSQNSNKLIKDCQETIGVLKEQNKRTDYYQVNPKFKNKTRNVQLKHTYTTDMPAELASPDSPILVPTKDFYDPAQFYFKSPDECTKIELFNALLMELCSRIQSLMGKDYPSTYYKASFTLRTGILQSSSLKTTSQFLKAYKESYTNLLNCLEKEDNVTLSSIKNNWTLKTLDKTKDTYGTAELIQEGLISGNPYQYLDNYKTVQEADFATLIDILKTYFTEEPLFKVYSVDSKR